MRHFGIALIFVLKSFICRRNAEGISVWMLHLHYSHFDPEHGKLSQYKLNPPYIFLSCLPFSLLPPFCPPPSTYL